jgi:hypothetical protein
MELSELAGEALRRGGGRPVRRSIAFAVVEEGTIHDHTHSTRAVPGAGRSQPVSAGSPIEEMPAPAVIPGRSRLQLVTPYRPATPGSRFESRRSRKIPANRHKVLSDRTRTRPGYTNARSSGAETPKRVAKPRSLGTIYSRFRPRRYQSRRRRATTQNGRRSRPYPTSRSNPVSAVSPVVTDGIDAAPQKGSGRSPRPALERKLAR